MAEKAAWNKAEYSDVKLATICPGFITGPELCCRNPTSSIAYLKGTVVFGTGKLLARDIKNLS